MVNGLLDLKSATLNVQATSGTLAAGDYELISFTSITGSNLLVGALPAGLAGTIVTTGTAIYLDVVVPPPTLTWTGSQTTASNTPTVNWSVSGARPPIATGWRSSSTTRRPPTAA